MSGPIERKADKQKAINHQRQRDKLEQVQRSCNHHFEKTGYFETDGWFGKNRTPVYTCTICMFKKCNHSESHIGNPTDEALRKLGYMNWNNYIS